MGAEPQNSRVHLSHRHKDDDPQRASRGIMAFGEHDALSSEKNISKGQGEKAVAQDLPQLLRTVTTRTLEFLSNASNQTLGACLVGLGASTYIILGRVGLVLIGVVGGVVLHATWDTSSYGGAAHGPGAISRDIPRRRELSLDIARRVLDWREKRTSLATLDLDESQYRSSDYSDFQPETAAALNTLSEAVIRDYVKWWYDPILPNELTFPSTSRKVWDSFILSIATHLSRKRPVDTFLEFATNSSSILIVFLNELSSALSAAPNLSASKAIASYLEKTPDSSLANILDEKVQHRKFQVMADDILESYLDAGVYRCAPVRVFLRQILANVVMEMTLQRCSSADWINEWIVYLFEGVEPENANANIVDTAVDTAVDAAVGTEFGDQSPRQIEISRTRSNIDRSRSKAAHARTVSRAEEAMQETMREVQRLTRMIAEEEAREAREREQSTEPSSTSAIDDESENGVQDIQTPASSQPDTSTVKELSSSQPDASAVEEVSPPPRPSLADSPSRDSTDTGNRALLSPITTTALATVDEQQPMVTLSQTHTQPRPSEPLTLHKASISIFDDSEPGEIQRAMKSKPLSEYLIQIEPASSAFSGWMIPRTYTDFEALHEVLRRIANITGVPFNSLHNELPAWKGNSKYRLREGLEKYLIDAVKFEPLAESEGMKRFLDKDRGATKSPQRQSGLGALGDVGKGMLDVLSKAPKGVAGGGKAVIGGVTSVFTSTNSPATSNQRRVAAAAAPISTGGTSSPSRQSLSVERNLSPSSSSLSVITPPSSNAGGEESPMKMPYPTSGRRSPRPSMSPRRGSSTAFSQDGSTRNSSTLSSEAQAQLDAQAAKLATNGEEIRLPPLPSEIPEDYGGPTYTTTTHMSADGTSLFDIPSPLRESKPLVDAASSAAASVATSTATSPISTPNPSASSTNISQMASKSQSQSQSHAANASGSAAPARPPLNESEASVVIELFFAVVTSLYTLSSAWQIRLTLLNAAKTFLLRPGNPQLESIRTLLQESLLDGNTSDAGVAAHILKLRENCLPTEAELALWPKERTPDEKESLRVKARSLLVKRGMPQALTSVMGAAASGEALGKVFDCLQERNIARGVAFGLMLQGARALTQ